MNHCFIFAPGFWKGEGTITFNMADDILTFMMHFTIDQEVGGAISFQQSVNINGVQDSMENHFLISSIQENSFHIKLTNDLVNEVEGKGLIDAKLIAWEFAKPEECEGFEIYEKISETEYSMRAEYMGGENFRTQIKGIIKKVS